MKSIQCTQSLNVKLVRVTLLEPLPMKTAMYCNFEVHFDAVFYQFLRQIDGKMAILALIEINRLITSLID